MNIYTILALILTALALGILAIRVIAPRLPRRKTALVNIRDRRNRIVGVERKEVD